MGVQGHAPSHQHAPAAQTRMAKEGGTQDGCVQRKRSRTKAHPQLQPLDTDPTLDIPGAREDEVTEKEETSGEDPLTEDPTVEDSEVAKTEAETTEGDSEATVVAIVAITRDMANMEVLVIMTIILGGNLRITKVRMITETPPGLLS